MSLKKSNHKVLNILNAWLDKHKLKLQEKCLFAALNFDTRGTEEYDRWISIHVYMGDAGPGYTMAHIVCDGDKSAIRIGLSQRWGRNFRWPSDKVRHLNLCDPKFFNKLYKILIQLRITVLFKYAHEEKELSESWEKLQKSEMHTQSQKLTPQ